MQEHRAANYVGHDLTWCCSQNVVEETLKVVDNLSGVVRLLAFTGAPYFEI